MKRIVYAALVAAGCAGTDGAFVDQDSPSSGMDDEQGADDGQGAELGTLQQALAEVPGVPGLPDGYGHDEPGGRCWTGGGAFGWAGGICRIPVSPSGWTIYVPTAASPKGCTSALLGGEANARALRNAITNSAYTWQYRLFSLGWDVQVVEGGEAAGDKKFAIKCSSEQRTDSQGRPKNAETTRSGCGFGDTDGCRSTPYGTLLWYKDIREVLLFPKNWTAKIADFEHVYNVVHHELGHVVGLGHDIPSETCLMADASSNYLSFCPSESSVTLAPTGFELDMLWDYAH